MKKIHKIFLLAIAALIIGIFSTDTTMAASQDYDAQTRELYAKQSELDEELAKPTPDGRKIENLSKQIGELQGKILATDAAQGQYRGRGNATYPDQPYRRHHHGSGYHHGGHGCW